MKKQFLSLLLALCMTMSLLPMTAWAVSVWDGTRPTANASYSFSDGDGSSATPYLISTAADLAQLAANVNDGTSYSGKYFKLTADIVLNDLSNVASWGTSAPANDWVPIGASLKPFSGTFDGQGYSVSGIYINSSSDLQGLFGNIGMIGKLTNLGVVNSYIKGGNFVGGIAGYCGGEVTNCYNTGAIIGTDSVGGIGGYLQSATIANCYNTGAISGTSYIGGIAGCLHLGSQVKYCYSTVKVIGGSTFTGGTVSNCGTIGASQIVTAGTAGNCGTVQTLLTGLTSGTSTLLEALNAYVSNQNQSYYYTWKADGGSTNGGYPILDAAYVSLTAPGAPTIGTATAGDGQATVSFTAPASNGGAAITGYTVTSSPGGLTGTGTSSPITVTGLTNGTAYTFTVTATNSVGTGSASSASNSVTPQLPQEATPTATFTATGADTGTLGSVTPAMKYSVDGGSNWTVITDTTMNITDVTTANGVKVYQQGNGTTTTDSSAQTITVTKATTPNLTATQPSTIGGSGSIPMTTAHEYSSNSGSNWTSATSTTTLAADTYLVRVKASGTVLASDNQSIPLTAFTGTKETIPAATFTATGPDTGTLSGVASGMKYQIGSGDWTDITSSTNINLTGLSACTISVVRKGNGTTTTDSSAQTITVTKAATPTTAGKTDCTTAANNNGKLTGVTATMEYKLSTAFVWTDGTGSDITSLANGTYNVRIKATGTVLASDAQNLTIAAYSAPSYGGGSYTPPTPITEIKNGGSTTGVNLDRLISGGKTLTVDGDKGAKLVFDTEALKGIGNQTTGDIKVEMKDVSPAHQENLPGKQVFSLAVFSGSSTISNFGGAVTVTLPYTLKDGETADKVTVWYLAGDGTMTEIPCTYDAAKGLATFKVTHFSLYVVGVDTPWVNPFTDVTAGEWFYRAVEFVNRNGLFAGTGADTFSPNSPMTRAMLWTVLGRADGHSLTGSGVFDAARTWAMSAGITDGTSPDGNVTREQVVTILWRYAGSPVAPNIDMTKFSDADHISSYAKDAFAWAIQKGIIKGDDNDNLNPNGMATRAEVATIFTSYN